MQKIHFHTKRKETGINAQTFYNIQTGTIYPVFWVPEKLVCLSSCSAHATGFAWLTRHTLLSMQPSKLTPTNNLSSLHSQTYSNKLIAKSFQQLKKLLSTLQNPCSTFTLPTAQHLQELQSKYCSNRCSHSCSTYSQQQTVFSVHKSRSQNTAETGVLVHT